MKIITVKRGRVQVQPDQPLFVLVSVKRTSSSKPFIEFWGPDGCGYTPVIGHAGLYGEADARAIGDGAATLAVPWRVAYGLAVPTPQYAGRGGTANLYDEEGPTVPNTEASWLTLALNSLSGAKEAFPVYKGLDEFYLRMSTKS